MGILAIAGTIHMVRPQVFDSVVPRFIPGSARGWVYVSGVAELAAAASLVSPRTRRVGGIATAALFVAVFPGNIQMALDADTTGARVLTIARLPLQIPLVIWALKASRES